MPTMSNSQRALQLWSLLAFAAMKRTVLTYEEVARLTGLPEYGLANVLGHVAQYCKEQKRPWLTALVVGKDTGKPASHLYDMMDVTAEQWKCFQYNWLDHGPTLKDMERPWEAQRAPQTQA